MPSSSPRWLPIAGLGALAILNIVLIAVLVLRPATPPADDQNAVRAPVPQTTEAETAAAPPTKAEPDDTPSKQAGMDALAPAERLLVNVKRPRFDAAPV